jgi:hypothetical protein
VAGSTHISENDIRSIFSDIGTTLAHSDTNISTLKRRAVVDTITSHSSKHVSSMEGVNHSDFGLRCATSDNERQNGQGINLFVGELVKFRSSGDHGVVDFLAEGVELVGDNPDLASDG